MRAGSILTTEGLRALGDAVMTMSPALDDADRIERVRLFEELKSAMAAAQAVEAAAFEVSQRAGQAIAGVPAGQQGRGVAAQLALAMRTSPFRAQRWLGWAKILTTELPATFAELAAGRTTDWRTMLVARETAVLCRKDRAVVDAELAPRLEGWGDRRVETETRKAAYRLDPVASVERTRRAAHDRRVSIRPAPDTMCRLTALLPVGQGVAAYAALTRAADSMTARGDERGRGQIMADTLAQLLTGQAVAADVPTEIVLVMDESILLGEPGTPGRGEPAWLQGYGPLPAGVARNLALGHSAEGSDAGRTAPRWLRRLYHKPGTNELVAMDTNRRTFTANQRRFLRLRDQTCRTPWCDAPIRHADHLNPWDAGGRTAIGNGQGLCQACNHAKQAVGWDARPGPHLRITLHTPTGHRYSSQPPSPPVGCRGSLVERRLRLRLAAA